MLILSVMLMCLTFLEETLIEVDIESIMGYVKDKVIM